MRATLTDRVVLEDALDRLIQRRLEKLERQIRSDLEATHAPEAEDILDQIPDRETPWQPMAVEELIAVEEALLGGWRAMILDRLGDD